MKITWFGGETLRIHIGGEIVVWRPAPKPGIATEELLSGADIVVKEPQELARLDAAAWLPRRAPTALDETKGGRVELFDLGSGTDLVDAPGENPLLIVTDIAPAAGRWAGDAVVVALSAEAAASALDALRPKLIVLAISEADAAEAVAALRDRLGGTALMALEPGLAVEI